MYFKLVTALVLVALAATDDRQRRHTRRSPPNIIYILGDDIGYNDVGWNNPNINTPHMDKLAKDGVILDQYYSMPLCTPSRATLLSGLYAQQLGLQRGVLKPTEPYGIPLKYKLLPERLKLRGYRTHAIGKWHLGFCDWRYTPTGRGFDTFLGFYQGAQENYHHCTSANFTFFPISRCDQYDFREQEKPARQFNGHYSSFVYSDRAVDIIKRHSALPRAPLFMYVSLTASHFPVQGDKFTVECERGTVQRREFCGAMMGIDKVVHNITQALKQYNLYDNSVIVFASDNGGAYHFGGNNFPLRGEKGSLYEGGSRVPAFIHSPLLRKTGYRCNGLFHIADWYATFLRLAGIRPQKELNGVDQWDAVSQGKPSPRTEFPYSMDVVGRSIFGAVRVGAYKLIDGPAGMSNSWYPEELTTDESFNSTYIVEYTTQEMFNPADRSPKLYNLAVDPYEKHNLAGKKPEKVAELRKRFNYYLHIAKRAVKLPNNPAGNPENAGGVYTPGWCVAEYNVPMIV